jgi:hypothetical protein
VQAEGRVGYLQGNVDVVVPSVESVEELRERSPIPPKSLVEGSPGDVLDTLHQLDEPVMVDVVHRSEADAAVSGHDRRDTVPGRGDHALVPRRLPVVVSVNVHEARAHQPTVGMDDPPGWLVDSPDLGYPAVNYRNVCLPSRRAGPVDDLAPADDQLVHGASPWSQSIGGGARERARNDDGSLGLRPEADTGGADGPEFSPTIGNAPRDERL